MTRRIGYLTAGGRPGDLEQVFWDSRGHYACAEITVPQPKWKIDDLKSWYRPPSANAPQERIVFGYFDFFYCGTNTQTNISDWKRSLLPGDTDPRFVRDEAGVIIPRFGGRGLFCPQPNSSASRSMVAGVTAKHLELGLHTRVDDHSRDLGWDFTGFLPGGVRVPHNRILWNGKTFTKSGADFIATDGAKFSEIYARAADSYIDMLRGYGGTDHNFVLNSGTQWMAGLAAQLKPGGRMQEQNITPGSFSSEPWNTQPPETSWPMALTYPSTWDRVVGMMNNKTLPANVVVIETHDCNGRIIAQPIEES